MEDINVKELKERMEQGDELLLIDVREPDENAEFNIGGKLIPLGSLMQQAEDELEDEKEKEIVVYCRSGNRSGMAKQLLLQMGFPKVRNLLGGMLEWQDTYPKG